MHYRLVKSEPSTYSREQFLRDKKTTRDGVRNYQARNNLQAMKNGDLCFRYHSNEGKEIVGIAKVVTEAFPDPTSDDPARVAVELIPHEPLGRPVTLEEIKADKKLEKMALVTHSRLSVSPVKEKEYKYILTLSKK